MPNKIRISPIFLGVISSLFFAATFVLNRAMSLDGGHWIWSAAFRFVWMLPLLMIIVGFRKGLKSTFIAIRANFWSWILWSTVGFGIFYSTLTFGAKFGPSWLVASTFETTIIFGMLLAPLLSPRAANQISKGSLAFSALIILGIIIMQISQAKFTSWADIAMGTIPVLIAAIAYPLGNRKMMMVTDGKLDAYQRTLGMTICSMPFWIILCFFAYQQDGLPSSGQLTQTFIVALSSGVIATVLFFTATDRVRNSPHKLAAVEATQSMEVIFALIGELLILHGAFPDMYSLAGIVLVIAGMILHSRHTT
ncbi:multidrug resistance efflux transporter family protein [Sphingobacterium spiritivorum]|uniref:DMT family transporter n=1 Tax=Sphingobacterium spiritivorum TaxID=258 RepID=UPI0019187CAE|nr:multidrug resistance efflux transporter family protein [Sphingobacterium spiritivorum]QQT25943.1 multidrug resistance efflux transporter family protein [Sphingobacterium spiritivorum]